jgi:NitT/TauT family transport system substrate-binding protein
VAKEKGFYDRENLDVEIVFFNNPGDQNTALTSGKIDVSSGALVAPILARAQGIPMKMIMAGHNTREGYNNWYATLPNSKVKTVKDVEGATVNTVSRGFFSHAVAATYLSRQGVDLNKVNFVGLPFQDSYAALKTGRADLATFIEPFFSLANKQSREEFGAPLRVLFTFEDSLGMDDIVLATPGLVMEETIQKNPEALRRYVRATIEAQRWGWKEENRAEVKQIIVKLARVPADTTAISQLAPGSLTGRFPVDPFTGESQLQKTQQLMIDAGLLKIDKPYPDDLLFDKQFLP